MAKMEAPSRLAAEVGEEYSSSLSDLTMNSKPLINMLTILAEESIEHAAVIVQSVEKHLDKVQSDIKLPVLYLVDSIIKNVGRAYTQLFSHIIVNMFCKVFKQVDEKTRSQMFKLRETWHGVFPDIKLYQLDVKVNLVDPAWPIQARPPQSSNIHVNPNFLNRSASNSTAPTSNTASTSFAQPSTLTPEEVKMREALARKEQELLQLQRIEMELAQKEKEVMEKRKALEKRETQQVLTIVPAHSTTSTKQKQMPSVVAPAAVQPHALKIAPVHPALLNAARRKDPRLAHLQQSSGPSQSLGPVQEPTTVTTSRRVDPRISRKAEVSPPVTSPKQDKSPSKSSRHSEKKKDKIRDHSDNNLRSNRISKLPPIPKIKSFEKQNEKSIHRDSPSSPTKRKKESDSPKSNRKHKKSKESLPKEIDTELKIPKKPILEENKKHKIKKHEPEVEKEEPAMETFKEMKRRSKERNYIRRNRDKSESPEDVDLRSQPQIVPTTVPESVSNGASGDVDLRTLPTTVPAILNAQQRKRSPPDGIQHEPNKKSKSGKLDELFGNEDVDLRKLAVVDDCLGPVDSSSNKDKIKSPPIKSKSTDRKDDKDSNEEDEEMEEESSLGNIKDVEGGWAKVKEIQSPQVLPNEPSLSNLDMVRAKLARATKKDGLGRLRIYSTSEDNKEKKKSRNKDTDMRMKNKSELGRDSLDSNIKIIMSQAEEQLQSGNINRDQYNVLLMQVLQLNERQKLKEAKQKESLEASKRRLHWLQKKNSENKDGAEVKERSTSPESDRSTDSPVNSLLENNLSAFGDVDLRVPPTVVFTNPPIATSSDEIKQKDSDMRMLNRIPDKILSKTDSNTLRSDNITHSLTPNINIEFNIRHPVSFPDGNMPPRPDSETPWRMGPRGFPPRNFRGPRPRNEEWGGQRGFRGRGPMGGNWRMSGGNRPMMEMPERMSLPNQSVFPVEPRKGLFLGPNPIPPYIKDERASPPMLGMFLGKEFTRVEPNVLDYMQRDSMKSISIDGVSREIRFYGTTALVLLDWDDPREIYFQPGQRKISIDDQTLSLCFNEDYTSFTIEGIVHRIKFGSPTRELFIDDMWFECFFGGPPIPIFLDGKVRFIKLDGPPPQVTIGEEKRMDLCVGKINLIVDAYTTVPIFLDAKPQLIEIGGVPHSLRFVDALETVLINEKPYKVEFGGLPKPIIVNNKKHFIRFTVLPRTVRAGAVRILNMEGKKPDIIAQPCLPPLVAPNFQPDKTSLGGLDILASIIPPSIAPSLQVGSYSALPTQPDIIPQPLKNIDVNSLFAKLVATGILQKPTEVKDEHPVSKTTSAVVKAEEKPTVVEEPVLVKISSVVKPVDLKKTETLKIKQPGLVSILHSGMQCGSCGARFPPEHTTKYSQHLDWHFRQNRAEKDSQRRPHSRRWYYDISDWVQFEEIEDLEEREKSWFERQQEEGAAVEASESIPSIQEEVSVVAPPPCAPTHQFKCGHCGDPFHQFYNQELEEWQLRRAVTYEATNYHPDCLEEYKASLTDKSTLETSGADEVVNLEKDEDVLMKEDDDWEAEDEQNGSHDVKDITEDEKNDQLDTDQIHQEDEDVVEVLSEKSQEEEVELVDDDDVVIKTEPIVEITVEDADTDEETEKERAARDEQYEIDFSNIKIKQEPVDPDDDPVITSEAIVTTHADTTHAAVISSIDGNVQLQPATVENAVGAPRIVINITKPMTSANQTPPHKPAASESTESQDNIEQPEVEPEYELKPTLQGVNFTKCSPTTRGNELSGLCSIM